jgi:hypothetical protein
MSVDTGCKEDSMKLATAVLLALSCLTGFRSETEPGPLEREMQRLGVRSALVLRSQAVDEQPFWSPQGDALAINVEGAWKRLDFKSSTLTEGTWHGTEPIGLLSDPPLSPVPATDARAWSESGKTDPLEVVTAAGTRVKIEAEDLGSRFVISRKGEKPETLWSTTLESCHGLSLSPDQRLVAFVCELNGVIVTRL